VCKNMKQEFRVGHAEANLRLDLFLAMQMDHLTRSFVKKQITANKVEVNGKLEYKSNYKVKPGDFIEIEYEEITNKLDDLEAENIDIDILSIFPLQVRLVLFGGNRIFSK